MKDRFMKNDVFSLEYDKETLRDIVLELQEENKILRENAEHNDKVVDNVNWENMLLKKENQELKKQLEVGEEQYNDLVEEKEELQEQLSIKTLQLEEIKLSKRDYTQENILEMKLTLKKNHQKEFIEYMNKTIEELECDDVDDEEMKGYLIQRIDTFKEILSKYKEIIGGK